MTLAGLANFYGIGALAALLGLLVLVVFAHLGVGYTSQALFAFSWPKLYFLAFWGGVGGMVALLPISINFNVLTLLTGLGVSYLYLGQYGYGTWWPQQWLAAGIHTPEMIALGVLTLVWVLVFRKLA